MKSSKNNEAGKKLQLKIKSLRLNFLNSITGFFCTLETFLI